jgi:hypothetical protein
MPRSGRRVASERSAVRVGPFMFAATSLDAGSDAAELRSSTTRLVCCIRSCSRSFIFLPCSCFTCASISLSLAQVAGARGASPRFAAGAARRAAGEGAGDLHASSCLFAELLAHLVLAIVGHAQPLRELQDALRLLRTARPRPGQLAFPLSCHTHTECNREALTCLAFSSLRRSSSRSLATSHSVCSAALPFVTTESGIFLACKRSGRGERAGCVGDDTISTTARRACCPPHARHCYSSPVCQWFCRLATGK